MEKVKILVVDDAEEYLAALRSTLERDFIVASATTLAAAKSSFEPDVRLALVDIRLSEEDTANRDGIELLSWLRAHHPEVPVVIMSAYREFDLAVDSLNQGAARFLKKPIQLSELRSVLHELAGRPSP